MMKTKSERESSTSPIVENKPLSPGNVPGFQQLQLEYPTPGSVLTQSMLPMIKQEPVEHGDSITVPWATQSELPTIQLGNYVPFASVKLESISTQDMDILATQEDLSKRFSFPTSRDADSQPHPVALFLHLSNPNETVTSGENGNMDVEQLDIPTEDQKSTVNSSLSVERNHDVVQHKNKTYICSFCDYSSSHKAPVTRHTRTHTGENHIHVQCMITNPLEHQSTRYRHMRTHTGQKPYLCLICNYRSADTGGLTQHMRTHTLEKPYSCSICDYKFTHKSVRDKHMRSHTGEKPYLCSICNHASANNCSLTQHMRTHVGEKPYQCLMCNYRSANKGSLTQHMRTHTGEKPYACALCDYKFTHIHNLQEHLRTHCGEKTYACQLCGSKYARSNGLSFHMRTHRAERS